MQTEKMTGNPAIIRPACIAPTLADRAQRVDEGPTRRLPGREIA